MAHQSIKDMLELKEQKCQGYIRYGTCKIVAIKSFMAEFGILAAPLVSAAIHMVDERYKGKADYLQVLYFKNGTTKTKFWLMADEYEDGNVVTAMLPEDY